MLVDKSLTIALLFSALFHTAILLPFSHFNSFTHKKIPSTIKIAYLAPITTSAKQHYVREMPAPKVQASTQKNTKNVAVNAKIEESVQPKEKSLEKKSIVFEPAKQYAKVAIPAQLPKGKEPAYLNYYQSIREEIRRSIMKNYPRFIACGEVCLYFVLLPDGSLKEIRVIEEKSTNNNLLKEVAEKSVRLTAPFLFFPEDLKQAQLSFSVTISFELED